MAKRFIDTNLFDDEWFGGLSKDGKLCWIYLITKCDHAGIFDKSRKLAEFQLSIKSFDTAMQELNGKVTILPNGKIFIPKFISYQYPKGLDRTVKPQKSVIDILAKFGIDVNTLTKELGNSMHTVQDKDKDKDKDKDTTTTLPKYELKSDVQKVVGGWKLYLGIDKEDREWDKVYFKRYSKSASMLLNLLGDWRNAVNCIQTVGNELKAKGLDFTLETIVSRADRWKVANKNEEESNGISRLPSGVYK